MEALRAELTRAKEQARSSNAAALKAAEELRAEKATHSESKEKIAKMAAKLKDTIDRCQLLEEENQAKAVSFNFTVILGIFSLVSLCAAFSAFNSSAAFKAAALLLLACSLARASST